MKITRKNQVINRFHKTTKTMLWNINSLFLLSSLYAVISIYPPHISSANCRIYPYSPEIPPMQHSTPTPAPPQQSSLQFAVSIFCDELIKVAYNFRPFHPPASAIPSSSILLSRPNQPEHLLWGIWAAHFPSRPESTRKADISPSIPPKNHRSF